MSDGPDGISVLYEHYKDLCARTASCETRRHRLFIAVIALLGLLILQQRYSAVLADTVSEVAVFGIILQLDKVPLPVFMSATWTFIALFLVSYYQAVVHIDKQYDSIHTLEGRLARTLGEEQFVKVESTGYLTKRYWLFRHCVWLFYIAVIPAIILVSVLVSIWLEWRETDIPLGHAIYDSTVAVVVLCVLISYLIGRWRRGAPTD